jgi:hypothetical protein
MRGDRAECAAGLHPSVTDDSAKGSGIRLAGPVQGAELDKDVPQVSVFEKEAILRQSFLGQGLLCDDSGFECGPDTQVCPLPGEEGAAVRTAVIVRLRIVKAVQLQCPSSLWAGH